MKNYLILSALLAFVPAAAQTSLGDYRQAVTEYSWELKVAASKSDAASQTMARLVRVTCRGCRSTAVSPPRYTTTTGWSGGISASFRNSC